jgi:hypothetical protein
MPDSPVDDVPFYGDGGQVEGIWLTATAWLPPDMLTSSPPGTAGFGQGGVLDRLPPGPALATFTTDAAGGLAGTGVPAPGTPGQPGPGSTEAPAGGPAGLAGLPDDELTGLITAWRKLSSWAQAGELAAVAELATRRHAEAAAAGERDSIAAEAATDEIAAALTLTGRAAQALADRATTLAELPATRAALADGRIDMPRALVLLNGLAGQDPTLARTIEARLIDQAPAQTTGRLRAALHQALLASDPESAERRRQAEEKNAWIEQVPEPGGCTASLTGRYLPVTATVTAWNHITALARQLRASGVPGSLDELRVRAYLTLLTGQPATTTGTADGTGTAGTAHGGTAAPGETAPGSVSGPPDGHTADTAHGSTDTPGPADPGTASYRASDAAILAVPSPGRLTGTVNLTIPLITLLGLADSPGELGGFGPITAHTARQIATGALDSRAVRWCATITGSHGEAIGHGCAVRAKPAAPGNWNFTINASALASVDCDHSRESTHYRPPPSLRHLIQIRNQRCTAPGCRMPATRCDDDHTLAFDQGGRSCECNLGPLCRHHHRIKQLQGWHLEQPEPGIFAWVTPSGWTYITGPENYAA